GFFHFGSKDVRFRSTEREIRSMLRGFLAESPQPTFFKTYSKLPRIRLSKPVSPAAVPGAQPGASRQHAVSDAAGNPAELFRVLLARRTHREFSHQPLSSEDLAQILFYTWGVTGYTTVPLLGSLPLKTSPSGG